MLNTNLCYTCITCPATEGFIHTPTPFGLLHFGLCQDCKNIYKSIPLVAQAVVERACAKQGIHLSKHPAIQEIIDALDAEDLICHGKEIDYDNQSE
jgi:hypothetical protein